MAEPFANDQLTAYLDGELGPAERAAVERELARDPALQEELDALRDVRVFLHRHGRSEAPDGFLRSVLDAVAAEPDPRPSLWAWLRRPFGVPLEAFAVAVVAVLVVFVVMRGTDDVATVDDAMVEAPAVERAPADVDRHAAARLRSERARPQGQAGSAITPSTSAPSRSLGSGEGETTGTTGVNGAPPTDGEAPQGLYGVSYRYRIVSTDPNAMSELLRLAAQHGGQVVDPAGRVVRDARSTTPSASYRVQLPSASVAAFTRALRSLGVVEEVPDERMFPTDDVSVQVDLEILPATTPAPSPMKRPYGASEE